MQIFLSVWLIEAIEIAKRAIKFQKGGKKRFHALICGLNAFLARLKLKKTIHDFMPNEEFSTASREIILWINGQKRLARKFYQKGIQDLEKSIDFKSKTNHLQALAGERYTLLLENITLPRKRSKKLLYKKTLDAISLFII